MSLYAKRVAGSESLNLDRQGQEDGRWSRWNSLRPLQKGTEEASRLPGGRRLLWQRFQTH